MTRKPRPRARTPLSGVSEARWVHQEAHGACHAAGTQGWIAAGWPKGGDSPGREHAGARSTLRATPQARKGDCGGRARGAILPVGNTREREALREARESLPGGKQ